MTPRRLRRDQELLVDALATGVHAQIKREKDDEAIARGEAIRCPTCRLTSYHPKDVANRFCAHCARFWGDDLMARWPPS